LSHPLKLRRSAISNHRLLLSHAVVFLPQDEEHYEQTTDVRSQLRFFEQLERMEKQRKDEQEREILLKAAKVPTLHSSVKFNSARLDFINHHQLCLVNPHYD